jgi:hypothetical protein
VQAAIQALDRIVFGTADKVESGTRTGRRAPPGKLRATRCRESLVLKRHVDSVGLRANLSEPLKQNDPDPILECFVPGLGGLPVQSPPDSAGQCGYNAIDPGWPPEARVSAPDRLRRPFCFESIRTSRTTRLSGGWNGDASVSWILM